MELVESIELKEPYLCLNMIVKNESHIIKDTLTKLLNKIPSIDYWVISDTGSTDKTKEIISNFFKERNIKGEIFDDEWKDFGHNRTLALEHAYKKSKYLLVFDADDEICGDFVLPDLKIDSYHLQFGDTNGTSYTRTQIVNNKKKWKYVGVLHEIITCTEHTDGMDIIKGKYYTISGKSGSRSQDQNKYQKDALVLEKAYEEAVKNNDGLYNRYGFYCANSYYDCGKWEDAIKWYKITLGNQNWSQEKYVSCSRLYNCYSALNQKETGMFYLVKSFSYDKERAECLYELVSYYCCNEMNEVAYGYYTIAKSFYNERYLKDGLNDRLFLDVSKANLFLPYYMILVSDKVKDHDTTIQMYRIIFTKKHIERSKHYIGNMLYNLQFFIERVKDDSAFFRLFQEYVEFLISINYPIYDHDFMVKYEKYGIVLPKFSEPVFSLDVCLKSKNILLYSGYSPLKWNYTFSINNALGGSETAITCLTKNFPKDYTIYVAGDVEEETVENIRYVHFNNLTNLIKTTAFHTVIVSRYLNFYELYRNFSAYQTFIWGHDITLYAYGTDLSVESILTKWAAKITGCICQTEWHKNLFLSSFPQLKDKISTINNGISSDLFNSKDITNVKKITNRFIYTSCSERGLYKLVQLWPIILENLPDAELVISSYNSFPKSEEDNKILEIINKTPSIKHLGKLNRTELYNLMGTAEYWLYTSYFQETSCITSLELLASEVICLYYPVAGLVNTIGDYGIPVSEGNELDTLLSLSMKKKTELKKKGKEYALSCSWKNRADEWTKIFFSKVQEPEQEKNQEPEKNNIKIINLKRREDRKNSMIEQFERENIKNSEYEFIEAVDGAELQETEEIKELFDGNNFNYKKSVVGCALSHLQIYNSLINDANNDYYVVLEDDVELSNDFKQKLNEITNEFVKQDIEHLALALSLSNNESELNGGGEDQQLQFFQKDVYRLWNIGFAYIISKKAARKIINFINNCSIKCAIDNPQAYGEVIKYHYANRFIVKHKNMDVFGSDINTNHNLLQFTDTNSKQDLRIAYCDWWYEEYCGGSFDFNDNFITDILRKYGNINSITVVQPHESPDVLLYSIFGNQHTHFPNLRKVFFSGEPFGIRAEAAFNFTFDRNSDKNIRFPLWLGYLNSCLLEECSRRKNGIINVPKRENFCSFIANGEVKTTHRRTIVDKLSKYKKVHCGGKYLNNIGFNVPRGVNCSGKIEHNNKYKFAIAFENEDYPGYVTEKICDIYKSNCVPIYWGTKEVVNDFNPSTFINARDFENFDELVAYIIKVDSDDELFSSFFKEPMFSNKWLDAFNDPNKTFYKNLADCIIGKNSNLYNNYLTQNRSSSKIKVFNIWHNKLFDKCYDKLDDYSLQKITMYDVNKKYSKEYNKERKYNIVSEYNLNHYNSLYQDTNYCQTSCLYHIFKNKLYTKTNYIGFIQYDMELASDFIYDMEQKINQSENDTYFYSLTVANKVEVNYICKPYDNSILEKYNNYFNTSHTYDSIKAHHKADKFICLHTFVIPTKTFINMMTWYCTITDWLHKNYINGIYSESMSEVTEEIFGLFLLLQMIENDNIQLEELKLHHEWPNLHNNTNFINYKDPVHYFSLDKIVDNRFTDKNTCHSYLETYEKLLKDKHLTCKNVLEIGIQHGGSMKLWNDYFVNANIYGIDINQEPDFLKEYKRVKCLKMNAYSQESIDYFSKQNIAFDFIIDDGPHTLETMIYFIKNYTQLLDTEGILIVEDIQDIKWCDTFKTLVLNGYTYEIIDLRHIKNRWDDILFVIKKETTIINKENKLCFDIGAHIGEWSLKNMNKYNKIVAVEASEITFNKLLKNIGENNSQIIPLNYAVCDSIEETIKFYNCESDVLSTINNKWLTGGESRFNVKYIETMCRTISIDKLIDIYGMPDLIKIDVESAEYECIKSLSKKCITLCFEWVSEYLCNIFNCLNYLYKLGYRNFYIQMNNDEYTFVPTEYYTIEKTKEILNKTTPKNEWGMIWCK
jgi:FkbM family methyltransferase